MKRFSVFDKKHVKYLRFICKKIDSCSSTPTLKRNISRIVSMNMNLSSAENFLRYSYVLNCSGKGLNKRHQGKNFEDFLKWGLVFLGPSATII